MDLSSKRKEFHKILVECLGSNNVYYQPPETVKMEYPCIIYSRSKIDQTYADNQPYLSVIRYQVTLIDTKPDSEIIMRIASLPSCIFDRHYTTNDLNHDVFLIYF